MLDPFTRILAIVGVILAMLVVAHLVFTMPAEASSGLTGKPPAKVDRQNSGRVQS